MLADGGDVGVGVFEPGYFAAVGRGPDAEILVLGNGILFRGDVAVAELGSDGFDVFDLTACRGMLRDRQECLSYASGKEEISRGASTTLREIKGGVAALASKTIVVQHREGILKRRWKVAWFGRARDAGDRAEILVDGAQIVIGQVAETRPRHRLEKVCAERSWNAAPVNHSCWASRVEVIHVHARPHDLNKFGKRVATYGQSSFIRCQVAGDDVRGA